MTGATPAEARVELNLRRRYRRILRFAALVLAQSWWFELFLPSVGMGKLAARGRVRRLKRVARRFRRLATELTGLMIKVGQFISSRLDVLPVEITRELEGLQDEVEPEPFNAVRQQVEQSLGIDLGLAFGTFAQTPIAAASLGQVHLASLPAGLVPIDGTAEIVVKVLRPGIEQVVEVDLRALRKIAVWVSRVKLVSRRADAPALIEEFAATTYEEIDYFNEARNLERFDGNFAADSYVATPSVIWERTSRRVLTLTNVAAIKISDVEGLRAAGIDPNAVAAEFARVTFQQIFVHGFFHADPHPGNIFVTASADSPGGFKLTYIDFGMMGTITGAQQENLRKFIFAVASRDARGWVESVERLKLLLPSADTVQLEVAIEALFKRFGGVGVNELVNTDPKVFRDFALQFAELVRALPFQVPENFLLLVRTISLVSGVTSSLNQEFNMWDALDPFARSLIQGGARGFLMTAITEAGAALLALGALPKRLDTTLTRLDRGDLSFRNPALERRVSQLERGQARATAATLFLTLFGGGLYLHVNHDPLGGWLLGASALPLLYALVAGRLP